jgi:hypothetical protein
MAGFPLRSPLLRVPPRPDSPAAKTKSCEPRILLSRVFVLVGCAATGLVCRGLSNAYRRPSHFSLRAQRKVTKRNGLAPPDGDKSVHDFALAGEAAAYRGAAAAMPRALGGRGERARFGSLSRCQWTRALCFAWRTAAASCADVRSIERRRTCRRFMRGPAVHAGRPRYSLRRRPPSPSFPSGRGIAAAPNGRRPAFLKHRALARSYPPRAHRAISLGYFSLGPQRKVTRAPVGVRKPAAGEPGRGKAHKSENRENKTQDQSFPSVAGGPSRRGCPPGEEMNPLAGKTRWRDITSVAREWSSYEGERDRAAGASWRTSSAVR